MMFHIVVWVALALTVLMLAAWRQVLDLHEDDSIHLKDGQAGLVKDQVDLARKISSLDRIGRALTVAAVVYGLAICGWVVYQQWIGSMKLS